MANNQSIYVSNSVGELKEIFLNMQNKQEQVHPESNSQVEKKIEPLQQHEDLDETIIDHLQTLGTSNESLKNLLMTLPPNYPVRHLIVNGVKVAVTKFISIDSDLAHFLSGTDIITVNINKIDAIEWFKKNSGYINLSFSLLKILMNLSIFY